jgi:xanthine dehydrogenase YagS FAD-binding subunit
VSVAPQVSSDSDCMAEVLLVLGGVASFPWRAEDAEKILQGQKLSEGLAKTAGEVAVADARPLRDNEYKVQLAKELIRRALRAVGLKD